MSLQETSSDRIVFMGTPIFATECLKALVEAKMNVVGVVTIPDKAVGRGQKIQFSNIKNYALSLNIPILQPENLKEETFISNLQALKADLFIVVAFRMLPKQVWAMPRLGTFNLHASLLPLYRGSAPIQRAIWNGEKKTGITTFLLDEKIDTGAVLEQVCVNIEPNDNAGTLHDKLLEIGKPAVVRTAQKLLYSSVIPIGQTQINPKENLPVAPKIFKEDCYLNWDFSAEKLLLQIRALSPYPGAIALLRDVKTGKKIPLKIFDAIISNNLLTSYEQNNLFSDLRSFIDVKCGDGIYISLLTLQAPGKKTLRVAEFLRGFRCESMENLEFCNYSI